METMDEFRERWDGKDTDELKRWVLSQVGLGRIAKFTGKATFELLGKRIHVRQTWTVTRMNWPFNINPNTLEADYELWILGWSLWYVIPAKAIRYMYDAPTAYRNSDNPEIVTVSLNEELEECRFARDEPPLDLSPYRHATLADLTSLSSV